MTPALAPRLWGGHLLVLVCVVAATGLGLWQYGAWQAARDAEARDLTTAEPVPLAEVMGPDDPFPGDRVGQPVTVAGTWVPDGTVLVSGREQDGRAGFWVVTPLAVGGAGAPALPVVRGWVADAADEPAPPTGPAEVEGWLQPTEGTGAADDDRADDVIPQVRTADLIQHVDQDLFGAYAVATTPASGLEQATLDALPEAGTFTGLRNVLYAIEWWVFGLFALFLWWRWLREELTHERSEGRAHEPGGGASGVPPSDPATGAEERRADPVPSEP